MIERPDETRGKEKERKRKKMRREEDVNSSGFPHFIPSHQVPTQFLKRVRVMDKKLSVSSSQSGSTGGEGGGFGTWSI